MDRKPLDRVSFTLGDEEFSLMPAQLHRLNEWLAEAAARIDEINRQAGRGPLVDMLSARGKVYTGVTGGNLGFTFVPTPLGTVIRVRDSITGAEIDLSDYDTW